MKFIKFMRFMKIMSFYCYLCKFKSLLWLFMKLWDLWSLKMISIMMMIMLWKFMKCESLFLTQMTMGVDSPLIDPLWSICLDELILCYDPRWSKLWWCICLRVKVMTKAIMKFMKFMIIEVYSSICPLMILCVIPWGYWLRTERDKRWESTRES